MAKPYLSAIILGLLTGLAACTTAVEPEQGEQAAADRPSREQNLPASAPKLTADPAAERTAAPETARPDEASPADPCRDAVTQLDLNLCSKESYEQAIAQLNRVSQEIQSDLSADAQQALSTAEAAWIEYRDRNCTFAKNQYAGGSIEPLIYHSCLEDHTKLRLAELQQPQPPEADYPAADAQLNETYQILLAVLSAPETEDMTDIQLAWIEYRDRNCAFEGIYRVDVIESSQCLARMSETRITQLEKDIEQRSL